MLKLITFLKPFSGYVLAAWIVAMLVVSSVPDIPTLRINTGRNHIRIDYLVHFLEYAILAFVAYLAFSGKDFNAGTRMFIAVTTGLVIFAIADEYHQKLIPGRTFNLKDLFSNVAGIVFSLVFCVSTFRKLRQ